MKLKQKDCTMHASSAPNPIATKYRDHFRALSCISSNAAIQIYIEQAKADEKGEGEELGRHLYEN